MILCIQPSILHAHTCTVRFRNAFSKTCFSSMRSFIHLALPKNPWDNSEIRQVHYKGWNGGEKLLFTFQLLAITYKPENYGNKTDPMDVWISTVSNVHSFRVDVHVCNSILQINMGRLNCITRYCVQINMIDKVVINIFTAWRDM